MKDDIWTYGTTKLLLLMACKEMVKRLEGTGVTCLTAWPGIAGQHATPSLCKPACWLCYYGRAVHLCYEKAAV